MKARICYKQKKIILEKKMYRVQIPHRNDDFNKWSLEFMQENEEQKQWVRTDPTTIFHEGFRKLFHDDVFSLGPNGIELIESSVRQGLSIPAILVIEGSKTYGREKKSNKLLYKCIPNDVRLPAFLVPYEMKRVGFSKVFPNLYVTIFFDSWEDKHPRGKLECVIGSVDVAEHFYEYQLYCKNLRSSIQKFQKAVQQKIDLGREEDLISNIWAKFPAIEDRSGHQVITIDPQGSVDFDDAFGLREGEKGHQLLTIYIANVVVWMDALQLWSSFSSRISTIYLPDKKRPMLPPILSDCLCSLQQQKKRFAFFLEMEIEGFCTIVDIRFGNAVIQVQKNYVYEEAGLHKNPMYFQTLNLVQLLSKAYPYHLSEANIKESHDVVSYLMVLMNHHCAAKLAEHEVGIFRSAILRDHLLPIHGLPEDVAKSIRIFKTTSGQYVVYSKDGAMRHALLELDAYVHITSPIRRLVDLLNMIEFQRVTELLISKDASLFYSSWRDKLDYINFTMKSIRRVQTECSLLDLCQHFPLDKEFDGYLFDKEERQDGLFQYNVFLPELKMTSQIKCAEEVEPYGLRKCKIYLFQDEETLKKKIRLQIVSKGL